MDSGVPIAHPDTNGGGPYDRIRYVKGFLAQIHRAIQEGANVKGYYLWSLLDNFEWTVATSARFGLIHCNFETQERIWKDSAYWYKKVIEQNGWSE